MKNIYNVLVLFVCLNNTIAQEYYYWASDQKYPLELYADKHYVVIEDKHRESFAQSLGILELEVSGLTPLNISKTILNINANITSNAENLYWGFVSRSISKEAIRSSEIIYAAPSFLVNGNEVGLSQFFYVKIKQEQDIYILNDLAKKNKVEVVGNDSFMPLWYILSCDKNSKGNALEMANLFYETGYFTSAQPDLLVDYGANCRNDTFFDQQWHLNNTGQFGGTLGNDIRICQAWDITMGCGDIVVAVLDHGLEFNHPDFNNISPISFNTETGAQPSVVLGDHGVAVAGIIGASANNGLGVAGVAPNVQLMSLSNNLILEPLASQRLSNGINFAWQNGADVINNSWGHNALPQQGLINDAINNAVTLGRGGLGTIVVFATGNDNSNTISFPSNNPQVIAVGAMSMCNQRKSPTSCDGENTWGSNFGAGLDVMAPGVLISTTDRQGVLGYNPNFAIHPGNGGTLVANDYADQNYTTWFNGTSSAAPQVAGIAALILSVNPNLTLQQVRNIIESTTDKIGNYSYTLGAGEQATLSWNSEMGYGRVNAFAAVKAAVPIDGPDFVCASGAVFSIDAPVGSTVSWTSSPAHLFSHSSGQGNTTPSISPASSSSRGVGTITFSVTGNCGVATFSKEVYVGTPDDALIVTASHWGPPIVREIDASTTTFAEATYNQVPVPGGHTHFIEEYEWDIWDTHSNWSIIPQHGGGPPFNADVEIDLWHNPLPAQQTIYVRVRNPCGWSLWQETFWDVVGGCSFCAFTVYPNPAAETLHIRLDHGEGKPSESKSNLASYTIGIYSENGNLVWEKETDSTEEHIPTAAWKEGFYHVRIHHPEGNYSQKVIIRH